jgi:hypothetical protein
MVEENKKGGEEYSIKQLLEQALMGQRDEMMENFSHILQRLPIEIGASSSRGHFQGTSPKVVASPKSNWAMLLIKEGNKYSGSKTRNQISHNTQRFIPFKSTYH